MENKKSEIKNITTFTETIYYESAKKILWEKSRTIIIKLFTFCTVIFIAIIMLLLNSGINSTVLSGVCFIAALWIFLIIFYIDIFTLRIRRRYRKNAQNGQVCIFNYDFKDTCIAAVWQTGTSTVFYDQISTIYYTKNTCILVADQKSHINECFVVDKNGFSAKSYDDFINFLKKRVTSININKEWRNI